jgi:putative membrane protein insertion efficiency factor
MLTESYAQKAMRRTCLPTILATIVHIPASILIGIVRLYQYTLSPILGRHCRFQPSCSAYFIEAVRKYGAIRGALRGLWRICRCNPWNPGGFDPP